MATFNLIFYWVHLLGAVAANHKNYKTNFRVGISAAKSKTAWSVTRIFSRRNSNCTSHDLKWSAVKNYFPTPAAALRMFAEQHFNSIMENQFLFTCYPIFCCCLWHVKNARNEVELTSRGRCTFHTIKSSDSCMQFTPKPNRKLPQCSQQGFNKSGKQ